MKSWLKIILKMVGAGFGSVFLFLCWNTLKDVVDFIIQGKPCEDLAYIPLQIIRGLFLVPYWRDWEFLFFAFGVFFILGAQFHTVVNINTQKYAKQLVIIFQIALIAISGLGINFEVQNELMIKNTYSNFCRAVYERNYALAYSYFSPEYRSKRGINQFVKEIIELPSKSYIGSCNGKFVGTISHRLSGAYLYPYQYSTSTCYLLLWGPELILVKNAGRWYFTGEHRWYVGS